MNIHFDYFVKMEHYEALIFIYLQYYICIEILPIIIMKKNYLNLYRKDSNFHSIALKFKNLSAKIDAFINSGQFWSFSKNEQAYLVRKLRRLYKKLSGFNPRYALKIAGAALCFVFISNKVDAQVFTEWPGNPFSSISGTYIDGAFADIDGDGDDDAILIDNSYPYPTPHYFENSGGTYVENSTANPFGSSETGTGIDIADFDGDGDLDAIIIDGNYSGHVTHYQLTGGIFTVTDTDPINAGSYYIYEGYKAKFCDVDGDGDLDIVVAGGYGTTSLIQGSLHSFASQDYTPITSSDFSYTSAEDLNLNMADMDGDGDEDLFIFDNNNPSAAMKYFENTDGSGNFNPNPTIPLPISQMSNTVFPLLVDLDGDGDIDIFTPNAAASTSNLRNGDVSAPSVSLSPFFALALFAASGFGIFRKHKKRNR